MTSASRSTQAQPLISSIPGSINTEQQDGEMARMESPSGKIEAQGLQDEVDRPSSPQIGQTWQDITLDGEEEPKTGAPDEQKGENNPPTLRRVRLQKKNSRYYFQHPYLRLFISYFIILCNFVIYAEDPVSHSVSPCTIPVIGNVFAFVINNYPPNGWSALKVFLWITGIIIGMLVGKFFVHQLVLRKWMKLSMFQEDKGSWMVMFLTSIISLFIFSLIFNAFLSVGGSDVAQYKVTSLLGFVNKTFMKAAGMGTWMGDFVTAWMVTDMMLQDKLYPHWNTRLRKWWKTGYNRIIMFWVVLFVATVIVATAITTDYINWDRYNNGIVSSNELSRAFLASIILVFDLCIVVQDWDFPTFRGNMDIKLPGVDTASVHIRLPRFLKRDNWTVHITGKWFNYGIIMLVIILDLNMWKNQIFYSPYEFGQYTAPTDHICTVEDRTFLATANQTMMTYDWRWSHINPATNTSYGAADSKMNAKYFEYSLGLKSIAFVPSIAAFLTFGLLVWFYGREEFVVEAIIVDGAPIQGIIIESYDMEDYPEERPIDSHGNSANGNGKSSKEGNKDSPAKEKRPLSKHFTGADSEVAGAGDDVTGPQLLNVQKVTFV